MHDTNERTSIRKAVSSIWHRKMVQMFIPAKLYIKLEFKSFTGKTLNLRKPKGYNEKLQWLKLHDRRPEYTQLVDKYEVRSYIAEKIGEQYLIPLFGVYGCYDDIDFAALPNEFVMKPTHTSGDIYLCRDKSAINASILRKVVNTWLNRNYYLVHREWPYKNIKPRIICEKYMVDESGVELKDYKFFCFQGEPQFMNLISGREKDTKLDFFDMSFNHIPVMLAYKNDTKRINRPSGFDEMVKLSRILAKGFLHVRVDFYDINGKIYFGELTFYPSAGLRYFEPEQYDETFGSLLVLPTD